MTDHYHLRKLFNKFWSVRNHKEVPPIPLVPKDDPTTLFTGSGMQPLVSYLLGEVHPLGNRLYNIQPCFRSQDIEEVGDNRHTTFFEMMGNWSLGNYFKQEQLAWFWEFLTKKLRLPKERLYISVFAGTKAGGGQRLPEDKDAYAIWKKLGLPESHIFKYGPDKNWWSRAGEPINMPAGEPGGPDSEVFYQFAQVAHHPKFGKQCHPNCDCGRFLEIGNSVFMEYRKNTDGTFSELPKKNVDFGGGLERILAALNNNPDMFITDIYQPIINRLGTSLNISYSGEKNKAVLRIIADHIKASSLLIKNGVSPGNKEQGYFLRRLIRRMVVKARNILGRLITVKEFDKAIDGVMEIYNQIYFEQADENIIKPVINEEINRFSTTLEKGLREINKLKEIDGKIAFDLYQSYGFPLEITEEIFKEKGQKIDKVQFAQEFKKHKNLSRQSAAGRFRGGLADQNEQTIRYHTATHLLHQALFNVLGSEIRQEGSNITSERLRFDFYSLKKPGDEELKRVETVVNEQIKKGLAVYSKVIAKAEAQEIGAKSFFREKYPDIVKVYFIEGFSKEFCGGPHVKNTSEIGEIKIFKFEKIGGNLYRIYAK